MKKRENKHDHAHDRVEYFGPSWIVCAYPRPMVCDEYQQDAQESHGDHAEHDRKMHEKPKPPVEEQSIRQKVSIVSWRCHLIKQNKKWVSFKLKLFWMNHVCILAKIIALVAKKFHTINNKIPINSKLRLNRYKITKCELELWHFTM